jgi:hypothetical protein
MGPFLSYEENIVVITAPKFRQRNSYIISFMSIGHCWANGQTREVLLKGKAQYRWPPSTNQLILAPFNVEIIVYLFTKQSTLTRRSSVPSRPSQLAFPVQSIVWQWKSDNSQQKMDGATGVGSWHLKSSAEIRKTTYEFLKIILKILFSLKEWRLRLTLVCGVLKWPRKNLFVSFS